MVQNTSKLHFNESGYDFRRNTTDIGMLSSISLEWYNEALSS